MNYTQNHKIAQVTENTLIVGVDIGSEQHYARAFDWRGLELTRKVFPFRNSLFHICFKPNHTIIIKYYNNVIVITLLYYFMVHDTMNVWTRFPLSAKILATNSQSC